MAKKTPFSEGFTPTSVKPFRHLLESEHEVTAAKLGFKPIKGKNQSYAYPTQLSYGGRSWTKQTSGGEHWTDNKLSGIKYSDTYGNILKVMNEDAKPETKLLATAPTIEGIQRQINKFWASVNYRVDPETLVITNMTGHPVPQGAAVQPHRNGYKFVMIRSAVTEDKDEDEDETPKCIYCNDKPVDPKHDPYCSNQCAINAERDNQDD